MYGERSVEVGSSLDVHNRPNAGICQRAGRPAQAGADQQTQSYILREGFHRA
jgi:hypothetical protein